MDACDRSAIQRLEAMLNELECEFYYLISDVNIDRKHELREKPHAVRNLYYASQCIAAACNAMRESQVTGRLEIAKADA